MLIADTHVHLYPAYDVAVALACAYRHLTAMVRGSEAVDVALLLTERYDCSFYRDLISGRHILPSGFSFRPAAEPGALVIENPSASIRLWLFAGRQVVTRDGVEVLALLTEAEFYDRHDTRETIDLIRAAGGLPVLSWSPGKWLGRRGAVIRSLIDESGESLLGIGDTAMRPCCWPTPGLMRRGRERGLPVLAGSDPLPFAGDEVSTGRYAIRTQEFDPQRPVSSLYALLGVGHFSIVGGRDPLPRSVRRWVSNQRVRKAVA
jgi:hypothetical protein